MLTMIKHNQGMLVAIILTVVLLIWTYGCESQVKSLITDQKVTRGELVLELNTETKRLEAELDKLQKEAELRFGELDRYDAIKAKIFDAVSVATTAGQFNLAGLATLAGSIIGIGAVVDNRIKDKVIANRPLSNNTTATV
jgi:hypothetical protein